MKWKAIYRCKNCKQEISWGQVLFSGGVCPHCGKIYLGSSIHYTKHSIKIESKPLSTFKIIKRKVRAWLKR